MNNHHLSILVNLQKWNLQHTFLREVKKDKQFGQKVLHESAKGRVMILKSTIQHYVRKEDKITQKNKMSLSATILKKPANNLYFIEKIKKNCGRNGQRTFLVKGQGFPHRQPIWEPEENIFPNKAIDS